MVVSAFFRSNNKHNHINWLPIWLVCLLKGPPAAINTNLEIRSMGPISELDMVSEFP